MSHSVNFSEVSVARGKRKILDNLNFQLPKGQIIGLLGPSGAGKTTIMRTIVDVQAGVSGNVTILDKNKHDKVLLRRVAYSTQSSSVFDDLSITDNLKYACKMLGIGLSRVDEVLAEVGLTSLAKQKVSKLSGGERNRVSLAIALVGNPDVLVLDEPTVGLDPVLRASLWDLFRKLAGEGKTLLISSHVMAEAERCDQIMFIRAGELIAFDTLPKILKATKTKTAEEAFLSLARGDN